MPAITSKLDSQLWETLKLSLKNEQYSNASFLGERLLAQTNSEEVRLKLSKAYNGESKPHKAYSVLKDCVSSTGKYKFALTCLKLNKLQEADRALSGIKIKDDEYHTRNLHAAILYTLGSLAEKEVRHKDAYNYYQKCVQLDPTMWVAYEKLCRFACTVNVGNFFYDNHSFVQKLNEEIIEDATKTPNIKFDIKEGEDPFASASPFNDETKMQQSNRQLNTPGIYNKKSNKTITAPYKNKQLTSSSQSMSSSEENYNVKPFALNYVGDAKKSEKKPTEIKPTPIFKTEAKSIDDIMGLFKVLGSAYAFQITCKCEEAIQIYKSLPKNQYRTGWVLAQVGKCYFEMVKYNEAESTFTELLRVEPYRLENLEYYSTVLWHLKKQVELCWLSNYMLEKWIYSPETWIVVGNCYSLQKEHETALKFFQRAIQLNPNFAYAHTLCGHEYVANEDFEQAKKCYQKALAADDKHYNAWWGLGNVFMKQEKYENAVQYFKSAVRLNDRSSVLYTYLGMAYFNWSKPSHLAQARDYFNKAEELDPKNPLNRYQKASVLIAMKEDKEALYMLLQLCETVPREAPIHLLIGKLYKKQMQKELALNHFQIALDLDPKNATLIKDLIDKIDYNDDRIEDNEM